MSKRRQPRRKSSEHRRAGHVRGGQELERRAPSRAVLVMLALAIAGVLLTAYLTGVKMFGATPLVCGAGSECDVVQSSRWSVLLGVPVAAWGLATYLLIAGLVWRARRRRRAWAHAWVVALVGVAISVYLTVVSVMEIEATCTYCLASLGLMVALLVGLSLARPAASGEPHLRPLLPGAAIAAAAVVVAMHLHFSGLFDPAAGPERPALRALATHLAQSGARFYGTYWCPVCGQQKALFEASAKRLPYVECTPDGRSGPRAVACLTNGVNAYPTWIIGNRRFEQVLEPPELAGLTDFDWAAATAADAQ
jgi:uncharacterized membrane protein